MTTPSEPPIVRCTWHYPGVGGDATKPSIDIVGSSPDTHRTQLERVWEMVLSSLRPIPLADAAR